MGTAYPALQSDPLLNDSNGTGVFNTERDVDVVDSGFDGVFSFK